MKPMLGVLVLLLVTVSGFAQTPKSTPALSEKQWETLLQALADEDWIKAADGAGKYLQEVKQEDNEHSLAKLRYMFMFASAAKVAEGKMTYQVLEAALKDFTGKEVMTPYATLTSNCPAFNVICSNAGDKYDFSLTSSNQRATYIYMFQYVRLAAKPEPVGGKTTGAVRGILEAIQYNPNQSNIWIMRVFIEQATLVFDE